ncbi:hypothetical protein [Celeribacter sp. PS-C1]|uniref:hypothetical protein n=1 Tax=Celeribacter sp. PS-C1 TaxID=2820813 RepID=UPI001CA516FB|nr:hypothetical protein [Celeribacter sp. PS-C1]MBW6418298.1 hypothetical protein [Celeribacter sp. PS-C1]
MDVAEIFDLGRWLQKQAPIIKRYQALQTALEHNATQSQKMPLREQLDQLLSGLREMPMTELNLQQIAHLDQTGVAKLIGPAGATYVENVVKQSSYDPATASSEIKAALQTVQRSLAEFRGVAETLTAAGFTFEEPEHVFVEGMANARIQFRNEASIDNISEMKKWSADWNDIVRGVGHLAGQTPHDMKVLSASKGSIIVCVSGTLTLVSLMALMSKKVSSIVLEGLKVANAIEDLRHKKISNQIIEQSMKDDLKTKQDALEEETVTALKDHAGVKYQPEHDAHLRIAVKKFVDFSKKGGEVDYLQPPANVDDDEDNEVLQDDQKQLTNELRELISEIRTIKGQTLLLEDQSVDSIE